LRKKGMQKAFTVIVEKDPESGWLVGEVGELARCYTQAPDLPALEANIKEAITGYLKSTILEEPLPSFVGTWRVEITADSTKAGTLSRTEKGNRGDGLSMGQV
jgi:predicted RNase H-like HicB family nuclease